jgi:hypothetical protein
VISRDELSYREALQDFGGVAFGFDEGPDLFDLAGLSDEEGTADDAHEGAAHELFLLPGAVFSNGLVIGIAEQREIEFVFFLEKSLGFDGIGAHSKNSHTQLVEIFFCVTKLGRFDRSTGSVCLWKEKEQDALASEVFERDFFAFVGFEAEGGGFVASFEHGTFLALDIESLTGKGSGRPGKAVLTRAKGRAACGGCR